MSESTTSNCCCVPAPGTTAPGLAPYVVSLQSLYGIISLGTLGGIVITTQGNTIYFSTDGTAGLGTVTSVQATSNNSNLTVTGGPVTVAGTFTFDLAGNLDSISGLVMAADEMLYSTGAATFATTGLTAFGRSLINDANAAAAQTTLGLVIGTNVQAWSADLDSFVTNASWAGGNVTFAGNIVGLAIGGTSGTFTSDVQIDSNFNVDGTATVGGTLTVTGVITGDGSGLTNISAEGIDTGILDVARGGTNIGSYTTGDLIYASAAGVLSVLNSGAAGTFLRFAGASTAPVVSTLVLPNAATTGDIFIATGTDTMGRLANVATGNVLLSGGVGVASAFGKVTSAHVNSTIPTMSGGVNSDITGFTQDITFSGNASVVNILNVTGSLWDQTSSPGNAGNLLTSNGTGVEWSNQITLDTLTINTAINVEGTITGSGTTGNQVINKPSGTVRIAAAGTSVIVTNSLCSTSSRVMACCSTNDATASVKNVVTTTGSFTINIVATTGEVEISWWLINIS